MNPAKPLPKFAVLSGIGYNVIAHEGVVIFEASHCIFGHHTRLCFNRTDEKGGGCWYFTFDSTYGQVSVSHIVAAYELLGEVFGKNFVELQPVP